MLTALCVLMSVGTGDFVFGQSAAPQKPEINLTGIGVGCPECVANRFYCVYAVSGEGGWYCRIADETLLYSTN
jgi:hypothetical protein